VYCPRCGEQNEDPDRFCSYCGQDLITYHRLWADTAKPLPKSVDRPLPGQPPMPQERPTPLAEPPLRIPSYLGWAAALLACCWPAWPAGVAALVFASRAEARLAAGGLAEAQGYSRKAKIWCWITLVAGSILWTISLAIIISRS
jgi:hypothetical protein